MSKSTRFTYFVKPSSKAHSSSHHYFLVGLTNWLLKFNSPRSLTSTMSLIAEIFKKSELVEVCIYNYWVAFETKYMLTGLIIEKKLIFFLDKLKVGSWIDSFDSIENKINKKK